MGYTQRSEITVIEADGTRRDLTDDEDRLFRARSEGWDYLSRNGSGKWYEEEHDLRRLSATMPGVTIECESVGEDGARWRHTARDGSSVRTAPTLVWPDPVINEATRPPAHPFRPLAEDEDDD